MPEPTQLSHIVFFTLKDKAEPTVAAFLASCREHLSGHRGEAFFAVGTRNPELNREVNDQEFDVGLHVIFESREAHDAYQVSPRHVAFIEQNKANWERVRVFDTDG